MLVAAVRLSVIIGKVNFLISGVLKHRFCMFHISFVVHLFRYNIYGRFIFLFLGDEFLLSIDILKNDFRLDMPIGNNDHLPEAQVFYVDYEIEYVDSVICQ